MISAIIFSKPPRFRAGVRHCVVARVSSLGSIPRLLFVFRSATRCEPVHMFIGTWLRTAHASGDVTRTPQHAHAPHTHRTATRARTHTAHAHGNGATPCAHTRTTRHAHTLHQSTTTPTSPDAYTARFNVEGAPPARYGVYVCHSVYMLQCHYM